MMAELRSLLTVEHQPLSTARPEGEAFYISLRAMIGAVGEKGEESFDFNVCSPVWLATELSRQPIVDGRFLLITQNFDPERIEGHVRRKIRQVSGNDWREVAGKIGRWAYWEFEDYQA